MAKKRGPKKKAGQGQAKETDLVLKGYEKFLGELKERIRSAQLKAAVSVNRELVLLYWQIGGTSSRGRKNMAGVRRSSTSLLATSAGSSLAWRAFRRET